jgi:hypothetical protein
MAQFILSTEQPQVRIGSPFAVNVSLDPGGHKIQRFGFLLSYSSSVPMNLVVQSNSAVVPELCRKQANDIYGLRVRVKCGTSYEGGIVTVAVITFDTSQSHLRGAVQFSLNEVFVYPSILSPYKSKNLATVGSPPLTVNIGD